MRTITLELPDDTPIMSLIEFAAQIQCDMRLVEHNRFRFERKTRSSATATRRNNVAQFPMIRQPGPGAA